MTVTPPKVRDFTTTERRLEVEVVSGEAFEVLLSLYALGSGEKEEDFLVGSEWFERVRATASAEALEDLGTLGEWAVWFSLIGEVYAIGSPFTMDRLLERIEGMEPVELRRSLLSIDSHLEEQSDPEFLEAMAAGDSDALAKAEDWCDKCPGLIRLLHMPPTETRDAIATMLRRFWKEASPVDEPTLCTLERDADHKRSLVRRMEPERLVETATNGVTVAAQPGLKGVVLVPSVIIRPWVLITEREGKRIFCYSVADENLGIDPDAPPAWLVQFYKALGDERRLSILRRLAEGPASFSDLVEHLDLKKSTVHHHVRKLRTAGLVRVTVGADKEYSLRTGAVPEAGRLLEGFLGTSPREE
jgi:DNA-binding transcriptional ArsR family regulator